MNINDNFKGSDYLVDLVGPYKMNRGTMGDHMITIDLNGGTGGPSYMKIFVGAMFL